MPSQDMQSHQPPSTLAALLSSVEAGGEGTAPKGSRLHYSVNSKTKLLINHVLLDKALTIFVDE